MSVELKPCPFCGGKAVFEQMDFGKADRRSVGMQFKIRCKKCGSTVPKSFGSVFIKLSKTGELNIWIDDRAEAIEAWNRRAET